MTILERLFPRTADNEYAGSRVALYALGVVLIPTVVRSLIHFFKDDSGVNSIATIHVFSGSPDPNQVIYLFSSLWGSQQLITAFIAIVVLWRYRSLVPLIWGLLVVEILFRLTAASLHPLSAEHYASRPPGAIMNLPALALFTTMFALSLRTARAPASDSLAQPARG